MCRATRLRPIATSYGRRALQSPRSSITDRPGIAQYLPAEPNEDTFIRSIYFQDPDGITLEFACWGRPLTEADVVHEPKTAADLNDEKQVETVRRAQAAAETAGLVPHAMQTR